MSAPTMTMPDVSPMQAWPERNQRWLATRIACWRERLDRQEDTPNGLPAELADTAADFQPAISRLQKLFGLSPFEAEILVLTSGIEIDAGFRASVARAQGTSPREPLRLSFSLALSLLPHSHWDAISPLGPLRHWELIDLDTASGVAHSQLRIDERVLHYLTGVAA